MDDERVNVGPKELVKVPMLENDAGQCVLLLEGQEGFLGCSWVLLRQWAVCVREQIHPAPRNRTPSVGVVRTFFGDWETPLP